MSDTTATEVGPPAGARPGQAPSRPRSARAARRCSGCPRRARAPTRARRARADRRVQTSLPIPLGVRHLSDRAPELPRVVEIHGVDAGDRPRRDLLGAHVRPQRQPSQIASFARASKPSTSSAGSASASPSSWAFAQRLRERHPRIRHARQDVVAGAVQDPEHPRDAVARQPVAQRGDDRDAAGPPSPRTAAGTRARARATQRRAAVGDELLVGRDDRFAGVEGALHPRRPRAPCRPSARRRCLPGGQHLVDVVGPPDARGDPVDALAGDVAVEDGGQLDAGRRLLGEDACHRSADRAEPEQRDAPPWAGIGARVGGHMWSSREPSIVGGPQRTRQIYGDYESIMTPDAI